MARPFLKWAGGKRQLISEIEARLPADIDECTTYVEPFVGGGAVLFHLLKTRSFEEIHISDLNPDLILCYRTLQDDAPKVITQLSKLVDPYPNEQDERENTFYGIRDEWNSDVGEIEALSKTQKYKRTAQTIFLNKTCFNGLFRVNKAGEFNVPIGSYDKPSFPRPEDLLDVQSALQGVTIHQGPFEECEKWVNAATFVYFDPPYRPLSDTAHFISYSNRDFNDHDQERLARLFRTLDGMGVQLMLSNSDPKNTVPDDDFFDALYSDFPIDRVLSHRSINSDGSSRGMINEILVRNYEVG
jgi:DNA adenine methylase